MCICIYIFLNISRYCIDVNVSIMMHLSISNMYICTKHVLSTTYRLRLWYPASLCARGSAIFLIVIFFCCRWLPRLCHASHPYWILVGDLRGWNHRPAWTLDRWMCVPRFTECLQLHGLRVRSRGHVSSGVSPALLQRCRTQGVWDF